MPDALGKSAGRITFSRCIERLNNLRAIEGAPRQAEFLEADLPGLRAQHQPRDERLLVEFGCAGAAVQGPIARGFKKARSDGLARRDMR